MIYFNVISFLGKKETARSLLKNITFYNNEQLPLNYNYYASVAHTDTSCAQAIIEMLEICLGKSMEISCPKLKRFVELYLTDTVLTNAFISIKLLFTTSSFALLIAHLASGSPFSIIHATLKISDIFVRFFTSLANFFESQTLILLANQLKKAMKIIQKPLYALSSYTALYLFTSIEQLMLLAIDTIFKNYSRLYMNFMKFICSFLITLAHQIAKFFIKSSCAYLHDAEFLKIIKEVTKKFSIIGLTMMLNQPSDNLNSVNFRSELIGSFKANKKLPNVNIILKDSYKAFIWSAQDYINFKNEASCNEAVVIDQKTEEVTKNTKKKMLKFAETEIKLKKYTMFLPAEYINGDYSEEPLSHQNKM